MTSDPPEFDDPSLKTAIGRLRKGHRAGDALRARVQDALRELPASEPIKLADAPSVRWRYGRPIAAAAVFLLAVGGGVCLVHYRENQQKVSASGYTSKGLVLDAMVAAHEAGASLASTDQAFSSPLDNPAALAAEAQKKLSRAVPTVDFSQQGWKLDAAVFCTIENFASIRLHFVREGRAQTFVSLPSSAWLAGHEGDRYAIVADGHPIAGFIRNGSLNCMVGDASVSSAETIRLRDLLCPPPTP